MTQVFDFRFILVGACLVVSACSDYEVKFNDRALFTPTPLFSKYVLQDRALNNCVRQHIIDERITQADELRVLVCTNAGIVSLTGLATFTEVQQLNLASNAITDIEPLARLAELRHLDLSDNLIVETLPLQTLAHLEEVNLMGNPALDCAQAEQLQALTNATVGMPKHCQKAAEAGP